MNTRKLASIIIVLAMLIAALAISVPMAPAAETCGIIARGEVDESHTTLGPFAVHEGDTILIQWYGHAHNADFIIRRGGIWLLAMDERPVPGSHFYTFDGDYHNVTVFVDLDRIVGDDYIGVTITLICESEEAALNVPGCDAFVQRPATAVMGRFTDNAAIFWQPGAMTNPPSVVEVGKTYWVDGVDASGLYRRVMIACEWYWVEADKVGPDYSSPSNGAPLPTHSVG